MEYQEALSIVKNARENLHTRYFKLKKEGQRMQRVRLFVGNGGTTIAFYKGRSRKLGYQAYDVPKWESLEPYGGDMAVTAQQVIRFLTKVCAMLSASGLWADVLYDFTLLLQLGEAKIQEFLDTPYTLKDENGKWCYPMRTWLEKHGISALVVPDLEGTVKKGIVKIPFGEDGDRVKRNFAEAIAKREQYCGGWFGKYDYTVCCSKPRPCEASMPDGYPKEYVAARYQAEYKGCGNGHYYMAIDAEHAIFVEDD